MELVAPAGNREKLEAAYRYGADAAYIGLGGLSLRAKADNFPIGEGPSLAAVKGGKRLYCALNILFRKADLDRLKESLDGISGFPFDAFIVSDPGIVPLLRRRFPRAELHLSTQASCSNPETAKFWRDLGFSRIIPSRELCLSEIEAMKEAVPDVELEVFVHGAMCVAYSGRCLLSAALAGRSANSGSCAHSCRWDYRLLEESERPGRPMPILEGEGFSLLLSSKDLNLSRDLGALRDAGVDALKIEGRMKSTYYVAATCQAYRAALSALQGAEGPCPEAFLEELDWVSHRPYFKGFLFPGSEGDAGIGGSYLGESTFLALVGESRPDGSAFLDVRNSFSEEDGLIALRPGKPPAQLGEFRLFDADGLPLKKAIHQGDCLLRAPEVLEPFSILVRRSGPRG